MAAPAQLVRSVLEYGSVVWHYHLTHAQSDKLEALQNRAVRIILYPLTGRLHGTIVGPTGRSDPGYVRLSIRPVGQTVGQTVAEPPTSVHQINVAC